jgi:hypothetical protein
MKRVLGESAAILVTVAGLLGMIWSFNLTPVILASCSLILLATGATVLIVRYVQSKRPEFTITDLKKILKIHDAGGHLSTFERSMTAISNVSGLNEVWYRNVAADGTIDNIKVDGQYPAQGDVVSELGLTHIRKRFGEPLKSGQQVSVKISYELRDSFVKDSEALIHVVNYKTKRVQLTVLFPPDRPYKKAVWTETYGGSKPHIIKKLTETEDTHQLDVEIDEPKRGGTYELRWDW